MAPPAADGRVETDDERDRVRATSSASPPSPTGAGCPAGATSPRGSGATRGGSGRTASAERPPAARRDRRPARRRVLRGPRGRPGAQRRRCRCCCRRRCSTRWCRTRHPGQRRAARRPGAALHAAARLRPAPGLAEPPVRDAATRCTRRRCGSSRGSRTATRPRCSPRSSRRVRSTAATAPGWTSSDRRPSRSTSTASPCDPPTGCEQILAYLRATPTVRDVVVSGGDVANMPWPRLEAFVVPAAGDRQHPRHPAGDQGARRSAAALAGRRHPGAAWNGWRVTAATRGVSLAVHTHANAAQQITPLVAEAAPRAAGGRRARRAQPGRAAARRQRHRRRRCSISASRCSTAPASRRTTSTSAT